MGKGPGYNMEDLVFYGMVFLGIILTFKVLEEFALDLHRIIRTLISLVAGLGIGWVALRLYQGGKTGGQDQF